jgi:(1->4)-alpha-D-glucan 1-alpha-D-glucosylmutase
MRNVAGMVGVLEHRSGMMPPPSVPIATYRLQLNASFGFDQAAAIIPYLKALGVSHLYASPFLKARAGSAHGYDVVDHNAFNPDLGGAAAFRRLAAALARADIGLILDFVPNHMGVNYADNAWWLDVLEWGPNSPHAATFDIDWNAHAIGRNGRVLLPILGRSYGEALERGEIALRYDAVEGSFSTWYYQHRFPIRPDQYGQILRMAIFTAQADASPIGSRLLALATAFQQPEVTRDTTQQLKSALANSGGSEVIERGVAAFRPTAPDTPAVAGLHHLLECQHYRLAHWRRAATDLNYRRFFDISSLAGLRVEDATTFTAIHELVGRLIASGDLQGLRLDHIDGLLDPAQYCQRLQDLIRARQPAGGTFYVVMEKILGESEPLPQFPGVAGTTGYEWLNVISRLLLDGRGLAALDRVWRDVSHDDRTFEQILQEAKRQVLENILAAEFTALTRLLARIAAGDFHTRDHSYARLRAALALFILHFPVYRTYITAVGAAPDDRATIETALTAARAQWGGAEDGIFDFLRAALTLDLIGSRESRHNAARVRRFALKVQQFTGPMMAKSLEDTAFYRYHRLIALNEVGGNPATGALAVADFHALMKRRNAQAPHGLTATATHDTKRGEDARTRLLCLSEMPADWAQAVATWRTMNAPLVRASGPARIPSAAHEYMIYQALLGAWTPNGVGANLSERMQAFVIKAAREGKEQTSWLDPDEDYESGLKGFVNALLDPARSAEFIASFGGLADRVALMGALASLVQLTLKITIPGVPDVYQGTELWDLSLVDPDNRRPIDFPARAQALRSLTGSVDWAALAKAWPDGRIKLALMARLLALRQEMANVFSAGDYRPLAVKGRDADQIVAFARRHDGEAVLIIVGRWFKRSTQCGRRWPTRHDWDATVVIDRFSALQQLLTEREPAQGPELAVSEIFDALPIAVLRARETHRTI